MDLITHSIKAFCGSTDISSDIQELHQILPHLESKYRKSKKNMKSNTLTTTYNTRTEELVNIRKLLPMYSRLKRKLTLHQRK